MTIPTLGLQETVVLQNYIPALQEWKLGVSQTALLGIVLQVIVLDAKIPTLGLQENAAQQNCIRTLREWRIGVLQIVHKDFVHQVTALIVTKSTIVVWMHSLNLHIFVKLFIRHIVI